MKRQKFQCRTRLCLWCKNPSVHGMIESIHVSMPHAALFVVQGCLISGKQGAICSFNAARGFVCGASPKAYPNTNGLPVSMPHAALFVVQEEILFPNLLQ